MRIQSAQLFYCSRSLVSGIQCDVEKLPHAIVRRTLPRGKCKIAVAIMPYSPKLAPSDFFLFPKMKEHHVGKRFANDKDLQNAVVT